MLHDGRYDFFLHLALDAVCSATAVQLDEHGIHAFTQALFAVMCLEEFRQLRIVIHSASPAKQGHSQADQCPFTRFYVGQVQSL